MKRIDYGICPNCFSELKPVWFIEDEYVYENGHQVRTGRQRRAVSHLECPTCMQKVCVDDSFDGRWHTPSSW